MCLALVVDASSIEERIKRKKKEEQHALDQLAASAPVPYQIPAQLIPDPASQSVDADALGVLARSARSRRRKKARKHLKKARKHRRKALKHKKKALKHKAKALKKLGPHAAALGLLR